MQNENDPSTFLIDLKVAHSSISATRRLEERLETIEGLISSGVKRRSIVELLNKNGFSFTINSFASALKRVRKKRGRSPKTKKNLTIASNLEEDQITLSSVQSTEPKKFEYDVHSPFEWKKSTT